MGQNPIRFEIIKFLVTHPGCITGEIVDHLPVRIELRSCQFRRDRHLEWAGGAEGFLYEPRWTWRAAYELGAEAAYPPQYRRADPNLWPQAFDGGEQDSDEWVPGASPHILVRRKTG